MAEHQAQEDVFPGKHGPVTEIFDQLGRIFRHILPGVLIVGAARLSHPEWFPCRLNWSDPGHLFVLSVVAIVAGNTWYLAHQYIPRELLVRVFFLCKESRGSPFVEWRSEIVQKSYPRENELRKYIWGRTGRVVYFSIFGEALLVFALFWPADQAFFARHRIAVATAGAIVSLAALWQQYLVHKIDRNALWPPDKER